MGSSLSNRGERECFIRLGDWLMLLSSHYISVHLSVLDMSEAPTHRYILPKAEPGDGQVVDHSECQTNADHDQTRLPKPTKPISKGTKIRESMCVHSVLRKSRGDLAQATHESQRL
eukprot:6466886-Amphidinium_carterae.1